MTSPHREKPRAARLIRRDQLEPYFVQLFGRGTRIVSITAAGQDTTPGLKGYGYGVPLRIDLETGGKKKRKTVVLETIKPGPFGHEHAADRAQGLLWDYSSYGRLPRHVHAVDVGAFTKEGEPFSVRDAEEFFLITEWADGTSYHVDLERLADCSRPEPIDVARTRALADYLADIHREKVDDPGLYRRRLRELVGHGECIMGLTDTYPAPFGFITPALLRSVEEAANEWRWRLRDKASRLSVVHGDFHPFNVLFGEGTDFRVLDRSRGELGEPADDLTALSINYLFFSLRRHRRFGGALEILFHELWSRYLERSADHEVTACAAPFYAFRGLVIAHPLWYPDLPAGVRRTLFTFIENVLHEPRFEPVDVQRYLGSSVSATRARSRSARRSPDVRSPARGPRATTRLRAPSSRSLHR